MIINFPSGKLIQEGRPVELEKVEYDTLMLVKSGGTPFRIWFLVHFKNVHLGRDPLRKNHNNLTRETQEPEVNMVPLLNQTTYFKFLKISHYVSRYRLNARKNNKSQTNNIY